MRSKNPLSDYNYKVFSASKYKEYTLIVPERHTSFNLINRSLKQLLLTNYQHIEKSQIRNEEANSGSGSLIAPHFSQTKEVISLHVKKSLCMHRTLRPERASVENSILPFQGAEIGGKLYEVVSKLWHNLFYAQSPDFRKPGLCYYPKFLYL